MQVLSNITKEQNDQIFEIIHQKAEEKKVAAVKKFDLKLKLIRKKSNACITASTIAATAAVTATIQVSKIFGIEKNDIIDEVLFEVPNIIFCFVSFS